jgi:transposase
MMAALIAGERDPQVLADLARTRMRLKIPQLHETFAELSLGTFDGHHRFLLSTLLARVDAVNDDIAALDAEIEGHLAPFADAAARLEQVPGIGPTTAAVLVAEIGVDMTRFPPGPPGLVGQVRPRRQLLGREGQGQRLGAVALRRNTPIRLSVESDFQCEVNRYAVLARPEISRKTPTASGWRSTQQCPSEAPSAVAARVHASTVCTNSH